MASMYRITIFVAVLSAAAGGGGCMTGDVDGDGAADHPAQSVDQFRGQALASGLTVAQAENLQRRVDDVLASIPGGRQVSATQISYDGLTATVDPLYSAKKSAVVPASISCADEWFCIVVEDTRFEFFKCQTWDLSNWLNNAPFNNNQTPGTVARAYDQSFNQIWSNTAKASGTVNVTPWWHFKPC